MKRSHIFLVFLLIFFLITITIVLPDNSVQTIIHKLLHSSIQIPSSTASDKPHLLGGFSLDTSEMANQSVKDGVQVAFEYGQPPSAQDALGQQFQSLHMKVVDGYIWWLLYYYECHRTKELRPDLLGPGQYCTDDPYPSLSSEHALLAAVTAHLKQMKDNQLITGYWVLDDWTQWDAGEAKPLLIAIHKLIQQYTPGRPAICGFGGTIWLHQEYGWDDWIADNFSPQGCDEVGLYIYTPSVPDSTPTTTFSDAFNWSMEAVLPAVFASLQKRNWDITKEPLIGIVQAFGGPIAHTHSYWIVPTAKDIETQSRSFCEHGASGLVFYAWDSSGFGPTTHTPMNSPEIALGIRDGIAACKQYWNT